MSDAYGSNPISDVANPKPIHRVAYVDTITKTTSAYRDPDEVFKTAKGRELAMSERETPETRTRRFRETRLVAHRGGVMACSFCHFAPYTCVCCNGLKCRCVVDGVYRHWTNGVPNPTRRELDLLEDVSL